MYLWKLSAMKGTIDKTLDELERSGNFRSIPRGVRCPDVVDFTSNDYLGLGFREDLRREFYSRNDVVSMQFSSSASRLLAMNQMSFTRFESFLSELYGGREALVFNSGYHANTGLVSALSAKNTVIIADRLVHASIIDGIKLGGCRFERFRHNDMAHLSKLAKKVVAEGMTPLIIAESVYSMDGDYADIEALAEIKRNCPGAILYIDEAHAVGVEGMHGLGLCRSSKAFDDIDIIVGTLGKALASVGAYAIMKGRLKDFAVNKARSFIFSTALPPINIEWSRFIIEKCLDMDAERSHLRIIGHRLSEIFASHGIETPASHIQPFVVGNPKLAVELSAELFNEGFNVLPIRTPTVPPGTDRLRLSLSAALSVEDIEKFGVVFAKVLKKFDL